MNEYYPLDYRKALVMRACLARLNRIIAMRACYPLACVLRACIHAMLSCTCFLHALMRACLACVHACHTCHACVRLRIGKKAFCTATRYWRFLLFDALLA